MLACLTELEDLTAHTGHDLSPRASGLGRTPQHFSQPGTTSSKLRCGLNESLQSSEVCLEVLEMCLLMAEVSEALLCVKAGRVHKVFLPLGEACLRITEDVFIAIPLTSVGGCCAER